MLNCGFVYFHLPSDSQLLRSSAKQRVFLALFAISLLNVGSFAIMWRVRQALDYRCFYAIGRIAHTSLDSIYSPQAQKQEQPKYPGSREVKIFCIHPPQELIVFMPLAQLPYATSLALWTALNVLFLCFSMRLLSMVIAVKWWRLAVISFAIFSTPYALYIGQDTLLLLLFLSAVLFLASRELDVLAGLCLALALFKPQIPVVVALALLLHGRRKLFGAFLISASVIAAVDLMAIGKSGIQSFLTLIRLQEHVEPAKIMPSIRGLLEFVPAPHAVSVVISLLLVSVCSLSWYRGKGLLPVFSSSILVGALTAHHFHAYDLAVLVIPFSYWLTRGITHLELALIVVIAASPVFFLLLLYHSCALLAIPLILLALLEVNPQRAGLLQAF